MSGKSALLMISGASAIVLLALFATAYLVDRSAPVSYDRSSEPGQNLLWPSADFNAGNWGHNPYVKIEPHTDKALDGHGWASRLVETADNGRHGIYTQLSGTAPGAVQTFSIYFKPVDRAIRLEIRDNPQKQYGTAICMQAGAYIEGNLIKAGDIITGANEDAGNGWYRCWAAMRFSLSNVVLNVDLIDLAGTLAYQGDGRSGALIWGAQFEPGIGPTRYVATSTGPARAGPSPQPIKNTGTGQQAH